MVPTHRHEGQIKFDGQDQNAQVYLDGGYAGTVGTVNSSWVQEGAHDVEVRNHGVRNHERVFVAAGKNVHVRPEALEPVTD